MADIIQAQIIDEEIVTPSADPVAHNMPGGGAVESVNGKTGAVVLTADDVGAVAAETFNTAMQGKQDKLTAGAGAEIKDGVLSATTLGITGAAVGQIARITAVDSYGKPTAWGPVDMPSGGGRNQWYKVKDFILSENVSDIVVGEDEEGIPLENYNPIGIAVYFDVPADSTQPKANGSPWIYPSATITDASIRAMGTISGWQTTRRRHTEMFLGNEHCLVGVGIVAQQLSPAAMSDFKIDGIRLFINQPDTNGHFPSQTRIIVIVLGVKP